MKSPVQVFSRPVGDPPPSGVAEPAPARLSRPGSASSSPTEVPTPSPPQTPVEIAGGPECPVVTANEYPDVGKLASWRGAVIMLVTGGSQFLDNVFMTSANIALPSIQKEFNVNSGNLQWMISAYTLTFGGFLLLAGVLSDRYVSCRIYSFLLARALSELRADTRRLSTDMVARIFSARVWYGSLFGLLPLALEIRSFKLPFFVVSKV